ncbi:MAG: hypothetical protein CTY19_11860 [Methylomonas sp.]|nr:MAG: hypothetical protein CTY19_11860 [Methylomonas sp.]
MISQRISRDFSPRLFTSRAGQHQKIRFSPQQLLEISQQISREYAPHKISHQSRLVLLAVSPRRLHAYWHVAKRLLTAALQKIETPPPLTLRIYTDADPASNLAEQTRSEPAWFDVEINKPDGQQDIWLPESIAVSKSANQYRAVLGELRTDQVFTPVAYSHAAAKSYGDRMWMRNDLPEAMAQFIIVAPNLASSAGKTASGQGKSAT